MASKRSKAAKAKRSGRTVPKMSKAAASGVKTQLGALIADASADGKAAAKHGKRDSRLPSIGTVIEKKDRTGKVRCRCTVKADRIEYKGQL